MHLPRSRTRIQRAGWLAFIAGMILFAIGSVACLPEIGSYEWSYSSVDHILSRIPEGLFHETWLAQSIPELGIYYGARAAACGALLIGIGDAALRMCRHLLGWVSSGT